MYTGKMGIVGAAEVVEERAEAFGEIGKETWAMFERTEAMLHEIDDGEVEVRRWLHKSMLALESAAAAIEQRGRELEGAAQAILGDN